MYIFNTNDFYRKKSNISNFVKTLGVMAILSVLNAGALFAQGITVNGIVSDASDGSTLPGVTVVVKGTSQGTIANANGAYTITVPDENSVLVFSFLGYAAQEILVGTQRTINLTMFEDAQALDEVVVVGYGTIRRSHLTGAVEHVDGRLLENRSVPTMTQALQGRVAGVNISTSNGAPGTDQNVNIRGYTGLSGIGSGNMAGPLIVIDGVQGGNLSNIDMNDVESLSFLKDAASAAIYGSSAPYGVIIVTTKRGRQGKPIINYNNNFGFSHAINLPKYANSLDFANAFNEVAANSGWSSPKYSDEVIGRIKDYQAGRLTEQTLKDPNADSYYSWDMAHANNDWFDIFFKNASFSQQHNISASGATDASTYYVGLGYTEQEGMFNFADDVYKRYNARVNLSTNLTPWLTFGARSAFSRGYINTPTNYANISGGGLDYARDYFHQLGRTYPTVPLKYPNGTYSEGSGVLIFTEGGRRIRTTDNGTLTGEFVIKPLPGWDITANYTFAGTYYNETNHRKTFYLTRPSGAQVPRGGSTPNSIFRRMERNQRHTVNAFTSYNFAYKDHSFRALVGFTQELIDNLRLDAQNTALISDEVPMIRQTTGVVSATDEASQLAIRGTFGRLAYNYQEKYLVEFTGRYDGSSRFTSENRMKFYPGISGAWVASRENFWEPIRQQVNQFKLRASYASLGDHAFVTGFYPFYPSMGNRAPGHGDNNWQFGSSGNLREANFWQPGLTNMDITWITVNTLSLGFDVLALNNRLSFSFDWYNRNAKDFATTGATYPAIIGAGAALANNAEIETKGFEITTGWRDRVGEVSYGVHLVLSDYVGKVIKFEGNPTKLINNHYAGRTQGEIWGYETVGLFNDPAVLANANQSIIHANWFLGDVHYRTFSEDGRLTNGSSTVDDPGDQRVIGNNTPRYSFGLTLNAEWKGFDATMFIQGVGKRDMMFADNANFFWGFAGDDWQSAYFTAHADRWTPDNPDGYFPRAYFNTNKNRRSQTRYIQDASYLRLKNLQLGYTLPKGITDVVNSQRARVFVNIENLATFTRLMKIIDPEIVNSEGKVYPLRRTWAFGINVSF